ncbi:MAG: carbohydrate ABC transporter permease [Spirochaetaceae bacterium]|nr:MAG: carbohydrate ABC transporter permease [Spirochaetaceae bacterium]
MTRVQKEQLTKIVWTAVAAVIGAFMVLPLIWMVSASLKTELEVFQYPIRWIPETIRWENYREVWAGIYPFWIFYVNSIKVTTLSVTGLLATSSLAAYSFAKLRYPGRDKIFLAYLSTMMIPPQVLLVPRFIIFRNIGILNTHWALILPGMFIIFGVFLLRQFFSTIPNELSESALMDGAGHLTIWSRIVLPLAKPAIISLLIVSFVWRWNDFEEPLIFLNTKELFTIPVAMTLFIDEFDTRYSLIMAATVSAIVPVLAVFLAGQRFFVQGVVTSGLKG